LIVTIFKKPERVSDSSQCFSTTKNDVQTFNLNLTNR